MLHAGDVYAQTDETGLRRVTFQDQEIVRRLYTAVRDPQWRDVPATVDWLRHQIRPDGQVRLAWDLDHRCGGEPLIAHCALRLAPDQVTFRVVYDVLDTAEVNRLGICVLHPLRQVGTPCRASREGQVLSPVRRLPVRVCPQPLDDGGTAPMLGPFDTLEIDDTVRLRFSFTGDLFEMEDQRNWLDASFKSYSTPLHRPRTRTLSVGDRIVQGVTISLSSPDPEPSPSCTPAVPAYVPAAVPAGASCRDGKPEAPTQVAALLTDTATDPTDLITLRTAGLDCVRIECRPDEPDGVAAAEVLATTAREARLPVHLVALLPVLADGHPDSEALHALQELVAHLAPELVLVHDAGAVSGAQTECTSPELLEHTAACLHQVMPELPVGGGTPFNLCELHRHELSHLPVATFSLTPTVHADDPDSVQETLESLPAVVASARARLGEDRALILGPLLGRERAPRTIGRGRTAPCPPLDWAVAACTTLVDLGVEGLCTLDVRHLCRHGRLTDAGRRILQATEVRRRALPPRYADSPARPTESSP